MTKGGASLLGGIGYVGLTSTISATLHAAMRQQYIAIHHYSKFPRATRSTYMAMSTLPRHVSRARAAAEGHMQRLAERFGNMIV
jgi:hypothetical protein